VEGVLKILFYVENKKDFCTTLLYSLTSLVSS
jgi:hypothetical protein